MNDHGLRFQAFDPNADFRVRYRKLPHWHQCGCALFITFRTIDSLPKEALEHIEAELIDWLRVRQIPVDQLSQTHSLARFEDNIQWTMLTQRTRTEFQKRVNYLYEWSIDKCYGSCPLRDPEISGMMADIIHYHDGQRYDLDRFVIMPNHVHALLQMRSGYELDVIGQSWMRYSARKINPIIGHQGAFWQGEPFDHIVRDDRQLERIRAYIEANPKKTRLKPGEYHYWSRG